MSGILRKQFEQNLKISEPKGKTIPTFNKKWKYDIDKNLKKLQDKEFSHDFNEKLKVKKQGVLERIRKRREKKFKKEN